MSLSWPNSPLAGFEVTAEAQQLKNYKTFKSLTSEWIELALAIAKAKLALAKQRLKTEAGNP